MLSLQDALAIWGGGALLATWSSWTWKMRSRTRRRTKPAEPPSLRWRRASATSWWPFGSIWRARGGTLQMRSEEHTSELQSLMRHSYAVSCFTKNNLSEQQPPTIARPDTT